MAIVSKTNEGNRPVAGEEASGMDRESQGKLSKGEDRAQDKVLDYQSPGSGKARAGVGPFSIYKPGQGYWTRMGTAAAAALIALLTAQFLYTYLRIWLPTNANGSPRTGLVLGIIAAFLVGVTGLMFWLLNRPKIVDFLVATESEMKKVNWTTRKELIGSTKVVILFMFFIAVLLFAVDMGFSYLFWLVGVLKSMGVS